jgi:hypothetical protein
MPIAQVDGKKIGSEEHAENMKRAQLAALESGLHDDNERTLEPKDTLRKRLENNIKNAVVICYRMHRTH